MAASGLRSSDFSQYGLMLDSGSDRITVDLRLERPSFVYGHRLKDCSIDAFAYFNAVGTSSACRCNVSRHAQIGESSAHSNIR
ncbi:hypothetical protein [Nevskia sp.]|uniref:hypothetical protein n=1 Tax=Nevskia sp. TaxID=1929292 RepID=UPI0025D13FB2|nr:hypothetical protein [Nevskia sp.]